MTVENFEGWYKDARISEAGKDDDPKDPGGRTGEGVLQVEYNVFRDKKDKPRRDVWCLADKSVESEAELREIYKSYWDKISGDLLPGGVDRVTADGSLNSGPRQSIKWLQRAVGAVDDGSIGPNTLKAIAEAKDYDLVVASMCNQRLDFMRKLPTWNHFKGGWTTRVNLMLKVGQALATGSVGPDPVSMRPLSGTAKAIDHASSGTTFFDHITHLFT